MNSKKYILFTSFLVAIVIISYLTDKLVRIAESHSGFLDKEEIHCEEYLNIGVCDTIFPKLGWNTETETILLFETSNMSLYMYQIDNYKGIDMRKFDGFYYEQFDQAFINPMRKISYGEYGLAIESEVKEIASNDIIIGFDPNSLIYEDVKNDSYLYAEMKSRGFAITDVNKSSRNDIIIRFNEAKKMQVIFIPYENYFRVYFAFPKDANFTLDKNMIRKIVKLH